jgi:hypothetical protein
MVPWWIERLVVATHLGRTRAADQDVFDVEVTVYQLAN